MAIDVFISSTLPRDACQALIERMYADHPHIFPKEFHLTGAVEASELSEKVLREEFAFPVVSDFIVGMNDKQSPNLAKTIGLVKSYFEEGTVIAIYDGREAFPPWPIDWSIAPGAPDAASCERRRETSGAGVPPAPAPVPGRRPTLAELLATLPRAGRLEWIGLRPARREDMQVVKAATLDPASGLLGDRYAGRDGARHVTLVQAEHLPAIAGFLGRERIEPAALRRNLVVAGINLLALKGRRFRIGAVTLEHTGACHPCSRMEETFGPGGYNAVRGHGGITARVIEGGVVRVGDGVAAEPATPDGAEGGTGAG